MSSAFPEEKQPRTNPDNVRIYLPCKSDLAPLLVLCCISLWSLNVIFAEHCAWSTHDLRFNLHRYAATAHAIADGQYLARWTREFNFGYGYPLLLFYPPATPMLVSLLSFLGLQILPSTKLLVICATLLTCVSSYLLGRALFGRSGGYLVALAYTLLPYRIETLVSRGAIAEYTAMGILPFLWLAFLQIGRTRGREAVFVAALVSCIVLLTHNATWMLAIPVSIIVAGLHARGNRLEAASLAILAVLAGMALSSFYLVPSVLEMKFIQIDNLTTASHLSFRNNMIPALRLWVETWPYAGLGKLFTLLFCLCALLPVSRKDAPLLLFFRLAPLLSFSLMLKWSLPVWEFVKPLQYIQFPWRLAGIAGLMTALTIGSMFCTIRHPVFRLISCLIITIAAAWLYRPFFIQQIFRYNESHELSAQQLIRSGTTAVVADEYQPVGVRTLPSVLFGPAETAMTVVSGEARVFKEVDASDRLSAWIVSPKGCTIRFNCVFYPGWSAEIDGRALPFELEADTTLMIASIPAGGHRVEWRFTRTPLRWVADSATLFSAVLFVLWGVRVRPIRGSAPKKTAT